MEDLVEAFRPGGRSDLAVPSAQQRLKAQLIRVRLRRG
jgi:hypothetical protein